MAFHFSEKLSYIKTYSFTKVSAAPLGLFRVLWGCVMTYYFYDLVFIRGKYMYVDTLFHFKYPFFDFVEKLSPSGMMLCFYVGFVASILMIFGLYYKTVAKILFLVYTYIFLIDVSYWNNHYYAYALLNGFFIFTDAHKAFSIDKKRLDLDGQIPQWQLILFQFQIMVVYFYGGLSKLQNKDWIMNVSGYSLVKNNLDLKHQYIYPISIIITYGGLAYDLLIPFFLKWRKTVFICLPFVLLFNITNKFIFSIGSFPYAMMASFILFIPGIYFERWSLFKSRESENKITERNTNKGIVLGFLSLFIIFQLLYPFRSWIIKGNVFWTGEGKLFSWHMMSSSNRTDSNNFNILEYNDDRTVLLRISKLDAADFLNAKQLRTITKLPQVAPQFAKFLKKESELAGFKNVSVTANLYMAKNFRPPHLMFEPNLDLSSVEVTYFRHNSWILLYDSEKGFFKN